MLVLEESVDQKSINISSILHQIFNDIQSIIYWYTIYDFNSVLIMSTIA